MAIYDFAGSHPHFEENPAYPYMRSESQGRVQFCNLAGEASLLTYRPCS